jgi:signal transduction histidine kinase
VLGAVDRIRAHEETEAARQRAEAFAEQAHQLAVLEERSRLARDSVSQALYGIVLGAQTARMFLDRDP